MEYYENTQHCCRIIYFGVREVEFQQGAKLASFNTYLDCIVCEGFVNKLNLFLRKYEGLFIILSGIYTYPT